MICINPKLETLDSPIWKVNLSNGMIAYQEEPDYNWKNLKKFVEEQNLKINEIEIQLRSNKQRAGPRDADGYLFFKGIGNFNSEFTLNYYYIGWVIDKQLFVSKWQVPEIILLGFENRGLEKYKDNIIWNKQK